MSSSKSMPVTLTYNPAWYALAIVETQSLTTGFFLYRYTQYAKPSGITALQLTIYKPTYNYSLLTAYWTFTFSAKEKDTETGFSYFGSRYYSSDLSIWLSVDPMSDKYPSLSPYAYCANNPIKLVDPNGEAVHPMGSEEYEMIINTLPQEDRAYVQLDKNGFIDKDLINSHQSESGNYNGLCDLVNDNITYDVILEDSEFPYMDQEGNAKSQIATYQGIWQYSEYDKDGSTTNQFTTGEGGVTGITLFPGSFCPTNSPDNNVKIYVNKQLSEAGRAESFSHEGFGHALLYSLNGHNAINAGHFYGPGGSDSNTTLRNMIISAKKETIKNMHQ